MRVSETITSKTSAAFVFGLACLTAWPVWADGNVVQVEEFWELRISQPDPERSAPQTTMVMSPTDSLNGAHFLFTLNHVTAPGFEAGGLQVQQWDDGDQVQECVASEIGALSHNEEVVTWTQRLTLDDGTLTFQVVDGESETWGSFGGSDLTLSTSTTLNRLNNYRPAVSLSESQVSYAENRVVSLVLTKLRWVKDNGQVHEQNAPIPIDTSLDE